jgi:hypothetical protein
MWDCAERSFSLTIVAFLNYFFFNFWYVSYTCDALFFS